MANDLIYFEIDAIDYNRDVLLKCISSILLKRNHQLREITDDYLDKIYDTFPIYNKKRDKMILRTYNIIGIKYRRLIKDIKEELSKKEWMPEGVKDEY